MKTILLYCAALVALLAVILTDQSDRPVKGQGEWKVQATHFCDDQGTANYCAGKILAVFPDAAVTITQEGR